MTVFKKPEFYFALYFHIFVYLKLLYPLLSLSSDIVLFISLIFIVFFSILATKTIKMQKLLRFALFNLVIIGIILVSLILFPIYNLTIPYITNIIIYSIFPSFLIVLIEDYGSVLKYHVILCFFTVLIILPEPFRNYPLTGGYMPFGFTMLHLGISGFLVAYIKYEKMIYLIFAIIASVPILIYGNKSAFLIASSLIILTFIQKFSKTGKIIVLPILATITVFGKQFLSSIIEKLINLGFRNYSILTFKQLLSSDASDSITSLRTLIWKDALEIAQKNPLGSGIGYFESVYSRYTHNVFLDILINFGYGGLFVFIFLLIFSFYNIKKTQNQSLKILKIGLFILWFLPMQISLTYWNIIQFWVFFAVVLIPTDYFKKSDVEENIIVRNGLNEKSI